MNEPSPVRLPGLRAFERTFSVPLDHCRPDGERIELFARELRDAEGGDERPWLLFLQGGPGFPAGRPVSASGWIARALRDFRVLLLDSRGTGRSAPVTRETLEALGDPARQLDHLRHFRADSIVADAELVRQVLSPDRPWSILGQSFGGFCALTYLSFHPEGLREVMITGGLAPLSGGPDPVYRALYPVVRARCDRYYARYPEDRARMSRIAERLREDPPLLPGGGRLTLRRFQQLGLLLGDAAGAEKLHHLLDEWFLCGGRIARRFLRAVEKELDFFETNPIYALLHEPIYCQGEAANWSAHRVRTEFPEFDGDGDGPLLFTGEMIYPWMFEDYGELAPLRPLAEAIASRSDWPPLYDLETLGVNQVPVAAVVYGDDLYVHRNLSEETARHLGSCRIWLTNEFEHTALRAHGEAIVDRLLAMLRGRV